MKGKRYPAAYDLVLRKQLEHLRIRGFAGGIISRHRAMLTLPLHPGRIIISLIMSLALLVLWLFLLNPVSHVWAQFMDFWREVLGLGGYVVMARYPLGETLYLDVPHIHTGTVPLTTGIWWAGAIITVIMAGVSVYVPRKHLPIAYLLRVLVFFQVFSQVFFAIAPGAFPYSVSGYVEVMLIAGLFLISIVPLVMGFTYYIFDFSLLRKLGLTLLIMFHLALMIPMQFMAHAFILHHVSLLFLPLLFLGFGLPANVLIFIAFYSWGVSWESVINRNDLRLVEQKNR